MAGNQAALALSPDPVPRAGEFGQFTEPDFLARGIGFHCDSPAPVEKGTLGQAVPVTGQQDGSILPQGDSLKGILGTQVPGFGPESLSGIRSYLYESGVLAQRTRHQKVPVFGLAYAIPQVISSSAELPFPFQSSLGIGLHQKDPGRTVLHETGLTHHQETTVPRLDDVVRMTLFPTAVVSSMPENLGSGTQSSLHKDSSK